MYRISPSTLQKFSAYIHADREFESDFNIVSEAAISQGLFPGMQPGDYKESYDEIANRREQELIDYINRAPREPSEASSKGTALNEVIDCIILNKKTTMDGLTIKSDRDAEIPVIHASLDGFDFHFDLTHCLSLAAMLRGSIPQFHCKAVMHTSKGDALLHGYIDYLRRDRVIDLKTTSRYAFGKFEEGWQKDLYPWCLIESGLMENVFDFEYLVATWKERKGCPSTWTISSEVYTYNHQKAQARLQETVEWFIDWLNSRRDYITDKTIFEQ